MIFELVEKLDRVFRFDRAKAHCDIPCGIYDPIIAQISALTVIRMIDLMHDLEKDNPTKDVAYQNKMSRFITVKEEHAENCKHEIRVIWGDYLKAEHIEKFPELDGLVRQIMKLGSECRQTANREKGLELLKTVNRFAEIFWQTKSLSVKKHKAPYKPEEEVVYPAL